MTGPRLATIVQTLLIGFLPGYALADNSQMICELNMDERAGSRIADSSTNAYHARIDGPSQRIEGVNQMAVRLPTGSTIIQPRLLGEDADQAAVSFYVRIEEPGASGPILYKQNDENNNTEDTVQLLINQHGQIEWGGYFSGRRFEPMTSAIALSPGEWYHVALAWGPTGRRLYVDGVLEGQHDYPAKLGGGSLSPLVIGGAFAMAIDEFQVMTDYTPAEVVKVRPTVELVAMNAPATCRQGDTVKVSFDIRVVVPTPTISGMEVRLDKNDHTMIRQWVQLPSMEGMSGKTITVGPLEFDMFDAPEGESFWVLQSKHANLQGLPEGGVVKTINVLKGPEL